MITLTVDPSVLANLAKSFTQNSATKALQKYTAQLERLLAEAIMLGRSPYDRKLNLYSISVDELWQNGPRIGPKKSRLHKWLEDNDLALIKNVEVGNNINGMKSKVKLTKLAKATEVFAIEKTASDSYRLLRDIDKIDQTTICSIAQNHYPDFSVEDWDNGTLRDVYDVVEVNRASLESYLYWVLNKTDKITDSKRQEYARHAQFVLTISKHFAGLFPQRKVKSDFGRTYYAGISIQNINKFLRRAIIAPACEYDVNTSVCAWKLGFACGNVDKRNRLQAIKDKHLSLYQYVSAKKEFIDSIRVDVFPGTAKKEHERQRKLIKSALTALSFGATLKVKGWTDASGVRCYPAISSVFGSNTAAAALFIKNDFVTAFQKDHDVIDSYLFAEFKKEHPEASKTPDFLKTERGRVSRSKVIAYLYQHYETTWMDEIRKFIAEKTKRKVLANIHDAIILDKKLSVDELTDLTQHIQTTQDNPFITLNRTVLDPFITETKRELAHEGSGRDIANIAKHLSGSGIEYIFE
jgi:hypothetical protein